MPERDPSTRLARWRASVPMRVTSWVIAAFCAFAAVAVQLDGPWEPSNLTLSAGYVAGGAFFWHLSSGYVDLYPDVVVIDGLARRHREVPLATLEAVEPGQYGLYFRTGDKSLTGPPTVGAKGLGLHLLRIQNRGDRIAARIMEAASEAQHDGAGGTR